MADLIPPKTTRKRKRRKPRGFEEETRANLRTAAPRRRGRRRGYRTGWCGIAAAPWSHARCPGIAVNGAKVTPREVPCRCKCHKSRAASPRD